MKHHTTQWVRKAEDELTGACALAGLKPPPRDLVCFHCQQAGEKYLKALLQELGAVVPRIHDLKELLRLLLPHDATLAPLKRAAAGLTKYAVEHRYPGARATTRQMLAALRNAERVRKELRVRLRLSP